MGNFSRDTFDRLKHYVGVRLQQGVPIVDADWNEMDDVRRYELRTFLTWFVGDGVPQGNDGFAVQATAETNDFRIRGGNGTADGAGRILVAGWEAINESDLRYAQQKLFNNNALAAEWGVDPLPLLTTPGSNRTDTVYLDVWEREVDSTEDPDQLVNPQIGVETAVRLKREWAVRVVEGSSAVPAAPPGHAYLALARLARTGGSASIGGSAITDLRRTGINLSTLRDNLATVQAEVTAARGGLTSLDQRLDVSLAETGQLKANTVGSAQVANGALGEAKITFDGAGGHNHSGGAQGRPIGSAGLATDAVLFDRIKWTVVVSATVNVPASGVATYVINNAYDGTLYFLAVTTVDALGTNVTSDIMADIVYRNTSASGLEKFIAVARFTNLTSVAANVTFHVYRIAES
ncbi:MAG TPA: DUF6519 domain-containing protein [Longimicrobium sp.]|nr:DUF6519 domain-containing protein [Longimicrobium sp.]